MTLILSAVNGVSDYLGSWTSQNFFLPFTYTSDEDEVFVIYSGTAHFTQIRQHLQIVLFSLRGGGRGMRQSTYTR